MASRASGNTDGFEEESEVGTDELLLPLEFGSSFPPLFSAVSIGVHHLGLLTALFLATAVTLILTATKPHLDGSRRQQENNIQDLHIQ
jgi:hypothetical protein